MAPQRKTTCDGCGVLKTLENCRERAPGYFMPKCRGCDGSVSAPFRTMKGPPRRKAAGGVLRLNGQFVAIVLPTEAESNPA
jgi:hypothetical protein